MKAMTPELQAERIQLINRYFTTFAICLVSLAIAMTQPAKPLAAFCVGLLVFTSLFNEATARWARTHPMQGQRLSDLRLAVNLGANCVLVYFLGAYFTPMWLLFALTPVASAVYSSRRRTGIVSAIVAVLIVGSHALRGFSAPLEWAQVAVQASFVVFLSLFINRLNDLLHGDPV